MADLNEKTCIICVESEDNNFTPCSQTSYERMKEFAIAWSTHGCYVELKKKLSTKSWSQGSIFYHGRCYNKLTHKKNLFNLKRRIEKAEAIQNKIRKIDDLRLCVICQEIKKDEPSKVSSTCVADEILNLKITSSASLKIRLESFSTTEDIIENNIVYHSVCLLNEKKKAPKDSAENVQTEATHAEINKDFLRTLKRDLTSMGSNSETIDMNQLVNRFEVLCRDANLNFPACSMKRYIKTMIEGEQDLMNQIEFYQYAPSKPAVLANKKVVSKLVCQNHFRENEENEPDYSNETAKDIRKELGAMKPWEFSGVFDDFQMPPKLTELVKSIISDNKPLSELKQKEIDSVASNIVQYICSNFKSDRQLNYQSAKSRGFEKHRLTPLSVGTALVNYQDNRSKKEIDFISGIGLSINYDKLERILTSIATTSVEVSSKNKLGIILPSCFKKGIRPIFAADNIDIGGDVSSFHGADLMIAQENDSTRESMFKEFTFDIRSQRSLTSSLAPEIDESVQLSTDKEVRYETALSLENTSQYTKCFQQLTIIWLLISQSKLAVTPANSHESQHIYETEHNLEDSNENINHDNMNSCKSLSWSAFHSLLSDPNVSLQNVAIVAPLYRRSPTEIPILIDILKRAMNISVLTVGENKKVIITLDGDLYGRGVRIPNYKDRWIIRLGSLHTVIAALKCLGKYIEGSGIDVAWEASGMYGSATVNQIIEARHIYRGIQAHTITLIALFHLKLQSDIFTEQDRQLILSKIHDVECETCTDIGKDSFKQSVLSLQEDFVANKLYEKLENTTTARKTVTFLDNYTTQVMNMLNYIGATRTRNWLQHLSSKGDMTKYFHAHDLSNYSKWAVKYLADMIELKSTDPESWKFFLDGNFTVTTNSCPFTSIDPDHAIEHQHKSIKSGRGLADIKDNESALERFALTIPILSRMVDEYKRQSNIKPSYEKEKMHHELVGNFFSNQLKSAQALTTVLSREGNPYEYVDLRNLMNFSVPRISICKDVCERDVLGEKALNKFRQERMASIFNMDDDNDEENPNIKIPFWSPLSKNNFQMFSDIHIIINDKQKTITTMKKEKQLYARMLFISKTRPELCPEKVIGEYEFTSIPPSNFGPDGSMIMSKSNESLINLIMNLKSSDKEANTEFELPNNEDSVIIINAMEAIEIIKKRKPMAKVSDLESHFMLELKKQIYGYSEFRLIFKQFQRSPLNDYKSTDKNLRKVAIYYHVNNNTPIKNIDNFLAHVNTRTELAIFLAQKVVECFKASTIKCLVAYESKYFVNKSLTGLTNLEEEHSFSDIKQIILSNVVDIARTNRNRILTINSIDIDLIVLLIGLFNHIPPYTTMKSDQSSIVIMDLYNRLGHKLSDSIIGWYAFHGMKDQGSFYGKGVKTQFSAFLKADDDILSAFQDFGTSLEIHESLIMKIEKFICMLYFKNQKSIKDVRFLMCGDGKNGNQLPPTLGTLVPHMSRAYYQALAFKMSIQTNQKIPPPTNYYWATTSEEDFVPVMCINPPAPDAILKLKKCTCRKSDCSTQSCMCRKNNLKCSPLCKCGDGCTNTKKDDEVDADGLQF